MAFLASDTELHSTSNMIVLANEAKQGGNYDVGIKWVKLFFETYLNTIDCNSAVFVAQMQTLKYCMYAQELFEDYDEYKKYIIRKMDTGRQGHFLKSFTFLLSDFKDDYYQSKEKWHTYKVHGDNTKAISFFENNVKAISPKTIEEYPFIEIWLNILKSDLYIYGGNYPKAQETLNRALSLSIEKFGKTSKEYAVTSMYQEIIYAYQEEYDKAIDMALAIWRIIYQSNTDCKEWYAINSRLQYYYYMKGNLEKSIQYGNNSAVRKSLYTIAPSFFDFSKYVVENDFNNPSSYLTMLNYEQIYFTLADAYYKMNDVEKAKSRASKVLYMLSKEVSNNYNSFAFNRASESLKKQVDYLVSKAPLYAYLIKNDSLLQSLSYNATLLYKQLTLNADKLFRNQITNLNNKILTTRYEQLQNMRKLLDNVNNQAVDSIVKEINRLELNLQGHISRRLGKEYLKMPTWVDIQMTLENDEIAIEFVNCENNEGKTVYLASVITRDLSYPATIELFKETELDSISDFYSSSQPYQLLWEPLKHYMSGKKRIYFSPTKRLYHIGIEYFKYPQKENSTISDIYSMYRLSSTRELLLKKNYSSVYKNAVLYGGIKYKLDDNELVQKNNHISDADSFNDKIELDKDDKFLRAGLVYLPGTKLEIEEISRILKEKRMNAICLSGKNATESSFKSLSKQDISLLHIATHGFYMKKKSRSRLGRLLTEQENSSTFEEKSLSRSGLMCAGAANAIDGMMRQTLIMDDGILTAKEIGRLDLTKVDMIVLSACETALGDLNSEGVFGLQRGFKRAGVKSIIMSLWKVADDATQILMTEFYRNLFLGKSKQDSFKEAQRFLRTTENGKFNSPEFWASFIMLDAYN